MGNVSSGSGAWPILGTKCQDIPASFSFQLFFLLICLTWASQLYRTRTLKCRNTPLTPHADFSPTLTLDFQTDQTVCRGKCIVNWNWQRVRQTGKETGQRDTRVFCLPSSCRGDRPGLAWCSSAKKERKKEKKKQRKGQKRKKKRHNQWDPFCFSGNPLLPLTTHTHTHTDRGTGWLNWCAIVCVCLCVWLPLPLCVCDWLYLRQGPFCFKPENGSETEAGPVIGLLRPCLAWERPSLARQCQANSCFQPQRGRTRWSEFRLASKTSTTPPPNTLLHPLL